MNIFEQYMFEELTKQYAESSLSSGNYEELYQKFCNIDYLPEVKPYLLTMRFFGLGTVIEKDSVLNELKDAIQTDNYILRGLYYDLLLSQNEHDAESLSGLLNMEKKGYTNIFTKENSFLGKLSPEKKEQKIDDSINVKINSGYISNWINPASEEITLSHPYILFTDRIISSITDILPILNSIVKNNVPLLIIAKNISEEVLEILKVNCYQHILISVCVKISSKNDAELYRILSDAAIICHGTVISETNGIPLPDITTDMLGQATTITIDKNITSIIVNEESQTKQKQTTTDIVVDSITFESGNYNGFYFTAGDVDYLHAKILIKPFPGKKHIIVRSQIFLDNDAFSEAITDEYDIDSNTLGFKTKGWGNEKFNCYKDNIYKWVIEIDGKATFSQVFRIYNGKINKTGLKINDVKLFASSSTGALEKDRDIYQTAFDGSNLEYIYFKVLIDTPGEYMNVQLFIKVKYLEDDSLFADNYFLHQLEGNTIAFWSGIGYPTPGKWKTGLYQYSIHIGNSPIYEGIFTVY